MTYSTGTSTGTSEDELTSTRPAIEQIINRAREVTAGVSEGGTQYAFRDFTDDPVIRKTPIVKPDGTKVSKTRLHTRSRRPGSVAAREHVARLLRDCQRISRELADSDDPIESALLGGQLTNGLHELWNYRRYRESDWVEILNVVQIAVPAEEFEFLPNVKRLAIVRVFNESLLTRTVGPDELERCLKILTDAGFNVWAGLSDTSLSDDG
jgi:hypothetical protein